MSALAHLTEYEAEAPATLTAIEHAESALLELYSHCDRLHKANIQHDPHSCVLCFEQR